MELEKWLDNTKMSAFERCPREFFLRHVLMLTKESEGSVATEFGKAFHKTLELYFSGTPTEEAIQQGALHLQESVSRLLEAGHERVFDDPRADIDTFIRAVQHFLTAGAGMELRSMTKSAKCELKLTLTDGDWSLLGRIDMLAETHAGQNLLVDFKTTAWGLRGWGNRLITDTQLQTYALIAVSTLVVDTVHAGAYAVLYVNRRKLASGQWSPNISLDSALFPLALTHDHLKRAEHRFRLCREQIQRAYESMHFPCIWSSCGRLGSGVCQFHPLCERFWSSDLRSELQHIYEVAFSLGYIQHRWHPFEDEDGR